MELNEVKENLKEAEEKLGRLERANADLIEEIRRHKASKQDLVRRICVLEDDKASLKKTVLDYKRRFDHFVHLIRTHLDPILGEDQFLLPTPVKPVRISRESSLADNPAVSSQETFKFKMTDGHSKEIELRQSRDTTPKRSRNSRIDFDEDDHGGRQEFKEPATKRSKISRDGTAQGTQGDARKTPTSKKRSVSASQVLDRKTFDRHCKLVASTLEFGNPAGNTSMRSKTPTGTISSWTRGQPIPTCVHSFLTCCVLVSWCGVCSRQITILGKNLQCEYCKMYVHERCKDRAPIPCLPPASMPTPGRNVNTRLALRTFCPTMQPYIPALLIRCICELEKKNRLNMEDIYRAQPRNVDEVCRLYKEFCSKFVPDMSLEPTEVITGCIMMFLSNLKEPLIPHSSYNEFMKAENDDEGLVKAIGDLPGPNRDTLAYLCLHLQKVLKCSAKNKMSVKDLASCFSSIVFGKDVKALNFTGNNMCDEMAQQVRVFERLLSFPPEVWTDYLNTRTFSDVFVMPEYPPIGQTPVFAKRTNNKAFDVFEQADSSILGPVSKTPLQNFIPRASNSNRIDSPLF